MMKKVSDNVHFLFFPLLPDFPLLDCVGGFAEGCWGWGLSFAGTAGCGGFCFSSSLRLPSVLEPTVEGGRDDGFSDELPAEDCRDMAGGERRSGEGAVEGSGEDGFARLAAAAGEFADGRVEERDSNGGRSGCAFDAAFASTHESVRE
jgi:hypothetical protein